MSITESQPRENSYLATVVRFANIIDLTLASIMVFARYNWVHTTRLALKCCSGSCISTTTLDLEKEKKEEN